MTSSPGQPVLARQKRPPALARVSITDPAPILSPKQRAKEKNERLFTKLLEQPIINIDKIRESAWMGIPGKLRPTVWRLFLDYEPISRDSSASTLKHKRKDYFDCLDRLYGKTQQALWTSSQKSTIHQIDIDLPRTPNKLLKDPRVKLLFQHILFVWAVRHPASGYVQGMNDILLPFFIVFLSSYIQDMSIEDICNLENIDSISDESLREIEGDCFWCFSKLLDGIQDVFTKDQPGLFRMISALEELLKKVDPVLSQTFASQGIETSQFAFKWMNCLLVREFHLHMLFRIWDLYLSQVTRIATVHVYVCGAMLTVLSPKIMENVQECSVFMQSLSPKSWSEDELETILAQAYVYEKSFAFTSNH